MKNPLRIVYRQTLARPRLILAVGLGLAAYWLLPASLASRTATRFLLSWNMGVGAYLLMALTMVWGSSREQLHRRALRQDEGQRTVLLLTLLSTVASLVAIVSELGVVKDMEGALKQWHIALTAVTVASSWLFTHLMFALHYAHDYTLNTSRGLPGGLEFPGTEAPDYGDFLYFAGVIGTSGQTADVSLSSPAMRRVGLLHCTVAFFFNTTVLALTINIAAGLI